MADEKETSILDDVRAASDELNAPAETPAASRETPEVAPEPVETEAERAARTRDEQGRFAKEPKEAKRPVLKLKDTEKPQALPRATTEPPSPAPAAPEKPTGEKIAAPQTWGGFAKTKWEYLPAAVQKEIAQRESDRDAAVADIAPVRELIDVNKEFLVNQAGSVPEAMRQMMQFAHMASTVDGSRQLIQHIAQRAGIDLRSFGGQPQAPATPQDPRELIAQLVQEQLQPLMAQTEQQQNQQIQTTIAQFEADPKHPFFNDVKVQMGHLLKAGTAQSMEEAYEQATWANPAIRASLLETQATEVTNRKKDEATKARAASRVNLRGSPLLNGSSGNANNPNSSVLDDVRAAAEEIGA